MKRFSWFTFDIDKCWKASLAHLNKVIELVIINVTQRIYFQNCSIITIKSLTTQCILQATCPISASCIFSEPLMQISPNCLVKLL